MSEQPARYTVGDMKLVPWPQPASAGLGRVETRWTLRMARLLVDMDIELVAERVKVTDPDLDVRPELAGDHELRVVFGWDNYDGEALSRSKVILQLVDDLVGPLVDLEGRPRGDWPFLS